MSFMGIFSFGQVYNEGGKMKKYFALEFVQFRTFTSEKINVRINTRSI